MLSQALALNGATVYIVGRRQHVLESAAATLSVRVFSSWPAIRV